MDEQDKEQEWIDAIRGLSQTIERLGLNGALCSMGAIELLSLEIKTLHESIDRAVGAFEEYMENQKED